MNTQNENMKVKGFFRLQIQEHNEDGTTSVVSDTGFRQNQIVNTGYDQFLARVIAQQTGSLFVTHAALGTGTVPASSATSLPGELTDAAGCRCAVSSSTTGSKTAQFTFNLASNVIVSPRTIANVGLFNGSTTSAGTMMAGNTYASSALATNQSVSGTYQIQFA
jgi:hypothetical protein